MWIYYLFRRIVHHFVQITLWFTWHTVCGIVGHLGNLIRNYIFKNLGHTPLSHWNNSLIGDNSQKNYSKDSFYWVVPCFHPLLSVVFFFLNKLLICGHKDLDKDNTGNVKIIIRFFFIVSQFHWNYSKKVQKDKRNQDKYKDIKCFHFPISKPVWFFIMTQSSNLSLPPCTNCSVTYISSLNKIVMSPIIWQYSTQTAYNPKTQDFFGSKYIVHKK